jgi:hypothetical protein
MSADSKRTLCYRHRTGGAVTPRGSYGMANPDSFLDPKQVREIRLLHLCDGVAASQIARDLGVNVSCISRIVNWKAWAHQDEDLRAIPKPGHKGGGDYHQLKPEGYVKPAPPQRLTCRSCLHLNSNTGVCDFGFPESLTSAYTFAAKCNVYQSLG